MAWSVASVSSQASIASFWAFVCCASISAAVFLCAPIRAWKLHSKSSIKVLPTRRGYIKLFLSSGFLILQLSSAKILSITYPGLAPFLSTAILLVAGANICLLSFIEHRRSLRPSSLLILYLLTSLFGDAIYLTVPRNQQKTSAISILIIGRICIELILLLSESQGKESLLGHSYQNLAPEETAGILERTLFWWINPIIRNGNKNILVAQELPPTDAKLSSKVLRRKILQSWDQRAKPERMTTLPFVLLHCLKGQFVSPILPRLFLIVFRYSQTVLIDVTIRFVTKNEVENDTGYWLVVAAFIIYTGMALSTAIYQHRLNRLKAMIRGALIGLIHYRSLHVESGTYDNADAVTLMSNDVDNLETTGEMFHETWAQLLEVVIGTTLLAKQIGWICLIPLFIIFLCSQMSRYVARNLKKRQKDWNVATQKRIAMTSSMLAAVKTMKMLGMAEAIKLKIQGLRDQEIETSKKLRWMMVAYNSSANALGIFSPVVTLVLFAAISMFKGDGKLDAQTAFTSTAILAMVTHPANMVMTIVPRAIASLANFERIQKYLLESSMLDHRSNLGEIKPRENGPTIVIDDMSIQHHPNSQPILRDINLNINKGSVMICSGPVGSGKTTLAKAILGEVLFSRGSISVSTRRIGYCAQTAWLPTGSIRDVICGSSMKSDVDYQWYDTVIHACGLRIDLDNFPDKDGTQIGRRGLNLSGGQRQRVALARAVYARCKILVLDDPFSGLDSKTEAHVIQYLLGPEGIFRKMEITVFWITNAAQYFQIADHIIVLGESTIQAQGTWDQLKHTTSQILKVALREGEKGKGVSHNQEVMKLPAPKRSAEDAIKDLTRKTGDISLYGYYFRAVGATDCLISIFCAASYSFFLTFSQYWLKWWTEASPKDALFYIGGFITLSILAWSITSVAAWSTQIRIAPRSGAILHQRLLETIIGVPLLYYSETNIGVILNRFGQDIQLVDKQLPPIFPSVFTQIFKLTMQAALLFSVQRLMTAVLPFCTVIVYIVQKVYLRTSRQLRFIELESRSAVYSSFLETVEGISTIRAFGWQKDFSQDNIVQLDNSQGPFYLLLCLQRWLNVVLDLMIAGVAVGVISLAVFFRGSTTGAQVGVALNMILVASTTLLKLVEYWTTLEISLGAIARLKSTVEEAPREDEIGEDLVPAEGWPSEGFVKLDNVTVSYNPTTIALSNINLKITAGQKAVICGRTGSGKSTLFLTLLGFLKPQTGSITIDGIDISHIPGEILRQRCFITVPQDPFILADATLRFNLDPSESLRDEAIVAALEKTQLYRHFMNPKSSDLQDISILDNRDTAKRTRDILNTLISSLPPLSTGQLQLLSLARAILRLKSTQTSHLSSGSEESYRDLYITKPILLLDEATSSLDPETDSVIQKVIGQEFVDEGHTVIVISHRMSVVGEGERDVVVWMKDGRVEGVGNGRDGELVGGEGDIVES